MKSVSKYQNHIQDELKHYELNTGLGDLEKALKELRGRPTYPGREKSRIILFPHLLYAYLDKLDRTFLTEALFSRFSVKLLDLVMNSFGMSTSTVYYVF